MLLQLLCTRFSFVFVFLERCGFQWEVVGLMEEKGLAESCVCFEMHWKNPKLFTSILYRLSGVKSQGQQL